MVHFVGAGPGAPDLITVRGQKLLEKADCVIYAGSLVNPALLEHTKEGALIRNSAEMTLEEVLEVMESMEEQGKTTVRLHTGDMSLYGAVREQMDRLDALGISYDDTPGVSSFCGAAAALRAEYTLPGVSQTVIISRMAGRTPVPGGEQISLLARHGASMVLFLSSGTCPPACCRPCRRNCSGGHILRTPRRHWYTRPPGRTRKSSTAPWAPWQNGVPPRASPRRPWCWWGIFWEMSTTGVCCTIRPSPPVSGKDRSDDPLPGVF